MIFNRIQCILASAVVFLSLIPTFGSSYPVGIVLDEYNSSREEALQEQSHTAIPYPYIGTWISVTDVTNFQSGLTVGAFRYVSIDGSSIGLGFIFQSTAGRVENFSRTSYDYINDFTRVPVFESALSKLYSSRQILKENEGLGSILHLDESNIERHGPYVETRFSYDNKRTLPAFFRNEGEYLVMTAEGSDEYFSRAPDSVLALHEILDPFSDGHTLYNLLNQADTLGPNSLYSCRGGTRSNAAYLEENSAEIASLLKLQWHRHNFQYHYFAQEYSLNDIVRQSIGISAKEFGASMFQDDPFSRTMENLILNLSIHMGRDDADNSQAYNKVMDDYHNEYMELLFLAQDRDSVGVSERITLELTEMMSNSDQLCLFD